MRLREAVEAGDVLAAARAYVAVGLSVIPVRADGSKAQALDKGQVEQYRERLPTDDELRGWFGAGRAVGVAVVCGKASGNLAVLDFETADVWDRWLDRVTATPFAAAVAAAPQVHTPRGGRHVYVRVRESWVAGGVLARRSKRELLAEVRGHGHYVLAAGSPPACHELNRPYRIASEGWLAHG